MFDTIVLLLATGFGLGWLPWAPGTFGSLIGIPLAWWVAAQPLGRQAASVALMLVTAVALCGWASLALGGGDASQIVADEYLAFPVAVMGLKIARRPWGMALAFLLFRLFDITKLPPIGITESIGGGVGIALDDVIAALYAWLVLMLIDTFWRRRRAG